MRYFMELAYDGGSFFGWQIQPNAVSVQGEIERVMSVLLRTPISITGCGRTDTGVHAKFYVAHFDAPDQIDVDQLAYRMNKMLPPSIGIFRIYPVSEDVHARFSAFRRTYRYFVHTGKDVFAKHSLQLAHEPDFDRMNQAATHFLGRQDFTSLSKVHTDVKTNICEVTQAKWEQVDSSHWYFEISADRFLRNMVRATVGTLLEVGSGKIVPADIQVILAAKDRSAAKTSVPANALFLWDIHYPNSQE